jgi:hypothetical protein
MGIGIYGDAGFAKIQCIPHVHSSRHCVLIVCVVNINSKK